MDSATARMAMVLELVGERHLDPNLASWAALAMFPFDDEVRARRRFRLAGRSGYEPACKSRVQATPSAAPAGLWGAGRCGREHDR